MKAAPIIAAAAALAACATIVPTPVEGTAAIGQSVRVGSLRVTPTSVIEDSRCPINARCIWAGRLILRARIDGRGWRKIAHFTLGEPYAIKGTTLVLVSAEPGKLAGSAPAPPASRFGFEIR